MSGIERLPRCPTHNQVNQWLIIVLAWTRINCDGSQRTHQYCLTLYMNFRNSPALKRTYVFEIGCRSCQLSAPSQERANEHRCSKPPVQHLKIMQSKIADLQNTITWNPIWSFPNTITNFCSISVLKLLRTGVRTCTLHSCIPLKRTVQRTLNIINNTSFLKSLYRLSWKRSVLLGNLSFQCRIFSYSTSKHV